MTHAEYMRDWRRRNPDSVRATEQKRPTAERREYERERQRRNPWRIVQAAVQRSRVRAKRHGVDRGSVTFYDFARLHLLPCQYCGVMPALGVDHTVPLYMGGANELHNFLPCCYSCNSRKGIHSGAWL